MPEFEKESLNDEKQLPLRSGIGKWGGVRHGLIFVMILTCINFNIIQFSSDQFSRSVVSDSLQPHESQHTRPPCPSPTPRVHSDPSSRWCHPAISSSVLPFSSCPQSLPASESFPVSQLFAWGGQSTGVSAWASVLPKKSQGWSPSEWTGWISLQSKGLSRVFFNTTVQKHQVKVIIWLLKLHIVYMHYSLHPQIYNLDQIKLN